MAIDLARLRRMVAEPELATYDDEALTAIVEAYPVVDAAGYDPADDDWTATYDLAAAAAQVWDEKASFEWDSYDFSQGTAGNATYNRSQRYEHAMRMARHYRRLARVTGSQLVIDRDLERSQKAKWSGYPSVIVDPAASYAADEFVEFEGDF